MTFIDDSPPLQTWGANNTVVESAEESDRSSGRVVLGTAAGDLYIFIQRGVRLIPREVIGHADHMLHACFVETRFVSR